MPASPPAYRPTRSDGSNAAPLHPRRPALRALTGLRFLAALYVLVFHAYHAGLGSYDNGLLRAVVQVGYTAVGFFFVLSGFILTYTYDDAAGTRPLSRRAFWVARVARIYPVYLVAALAGVGFWWLWVGRAFLPGAAPRGLLDAGLTTAALLTAWRADLIGTPLDINVVGWSVSAEAFFYLVFPLALLGARRLAPRLLLPCVIGLWLVALAAPTWYMVADPDGLRFAEVASWVFWLNVVRFNPLLRLPEFLAGVACGRWFVRQGAPHRPALGTALVLGALAAAGAVLPIAWRIYPLMHSGLLIPAFAALVVGLALGSPLGAVLTSRLIVALGEASYAFYLLHFTLLGLFLERAGHHPLLAGMRHRPSGLLAVATCTGIASLLTHRLLEEPARRWIRRRFARPQIVRHAAD